MGKLPLSFILSKKIQIKPIIIIIYNLFVFKSNKFVPSFIKSPKIMIIVSLGSTNLKYDDTIRKAALWEWG